VSKEVTTLMNKFRKLEGYSTLHWCLFYLLGHYFKEEKGAKSPINLYLGEFLAF
jgi:hypothetical protein